MQQFLPQIFNVFGTPLGFMFTRLRISASSSQRALHLPSPHRCSRRTIFQSFVARTDKFLDPDEEDDAIGEAILEGLDIPEDDEARYIPSYEQWLAGPGLRYRDPAPRNWLSSKTVCSLNLHLNVRCSLFLALPSQSIIPSTTACLRCFTHSYLWVLHD
jgi:hypothetical protein